MFRLIYLNFLNSWKMKIIDFKKEAEKHERLIWQCDCGNCCFKLYEDGEIECTDCGTIQNGYEEHYQVIEKWTRKEVFDD